MVSGDSNINCYYLFFEMEPKGGGGGFTTGGRRGGKTVGGESVHQKNSSFWWKNRKICIFCPRFEFGTIFCYENGQFHDYS